MCKTGHGRPGWMLHRPLVYQAIICSPLEIMPRLGPAFGHQHCTAKRSMQSPYLTNSRREAAVGSSMRACCCSTSGSTCTPFRMRGAAKSLKMPALESCRLHWPAAQHVPNSTCLSQQQDFLQDSAGREQLTAHISQPATSRKGFICNLAQMQ